MVVNGKAQFFDHLEIEMDDSILILLVDRKFIKDGLDHGVNAVGHIQILMNLRSHCWFIRWMLITIVFIHFLLEGQGSNLLGGL